MDNSNLQVNEQQFSYQDPDAPENEGARTFDQLGGDNQSLSSNANTFQKEKLNVLNNFSGIMQNFTIDSEGMHHYRSGAHLDTQDIESKYLGETNIYGNKSSTVNNESKNICFDITSNDNKEIL